MGEPVHVSLPQMVDLAIGTPETGSVNFNVLYDLLHIIVHKIDVNADIEFHGEEKERLQSLIEAGVSGPFITVTDYDVVSKEETVEEGEQTGSTKEKKHTVVVVKPFEGEKPKKKPAPRKNVSKRTSNTAHSIEKLQKSVSKLQERVATIDSMPPYELLNQTRVSSGQPIGDMWNILNIQKRMDAAEEGISKLTGLVEELARETRDSLGAQAFKASDTETPVLQTSEGIAADILKQIEKRIWDLENRMKKSESKYSQMQQQPIQEATGELRPMLDEVGLNDIISSLKSDMDDMREQIVECKENQQGGGTGYDDLLSEIKTLKIIVESTPSPEDTKNLETRIDNLYNQVQNLEGSLIATLEDISQQMINIEKELGQIVERVNAALPSGEGPTDFTGLSDLYNKIQALQSDLENLNLTTTKLIGEREETELRAEALREQVEMLKLVKADKEALEDALADKADQFTVNRKVSHDQFDAAYDDLAHGLEEALSKLQQQENVWQQALSDIQHEIENKLDKLELTPLKEFVTNKLKGVQEKIKALSVLHQDYEAAGTKKKLLRDVNCISCDRDVVMKKEIDPSTQVPRAPLPPTRNMKPYLTYELDQVRKQQRKLPQARNMLHYEEAVQGKDVRRKQKDGPQLIKGPGHLCNRYCGGSHTITTPQQRVTRVGHFLMQWGPEAVQLMQGKMKDAKGKESKTSEEEIEQVIRKVSVATSMSSKGSHASSQRQIPQKIVDEILEEITEEPTVETRKLSSALEVAQLTMEDLTTWVVENAAGASSAVGTSSATDAVAAVLGGFGAAPLSSVEEEGEEAAGAPEEIEAGPAEVEEEAEEYVGQMEDYEEEEFDTEEPEPKDEQD